MNDQNTDIIVSYYAAHVQLAGECSIIIVTLHTNEQKLSLIWFHLPTTDKARCSCNDAWRRSGSQEWLPETMVINDVMDIEYIIWPKVCECLSGTPICGSIVNFSNKVGSRLFFRMFLYAVAVRIPFSGTERT